MCIWLPVASIDGTFKRGECASQQRRQNTQGVCQTVHVSFRTLYSCPKEKALLLKIKQNIIKSFIIRLFGTNDGFKCANTFLKQMPICVCTRVSVCMGVCVHVCVCEYARTHLLGPCVSPPHFLPHPLHLLPSVPSVLPPCLDWAEAEIMVFSLLKSFH